MKQAAVLLFVLLIIGNRKSSAQSGTEKPELVIMSYNIHHANPPSVKDKIDLDAVADVIIKAQPDIVALQEVDVNTIRSGKEVNEAEVIASKTNMHYYFSKAIDFEGGEYGVAILSKTPLRESRTYRLPNVDGVAGEPRVLATTEIELPGKSQLLFACTHLDAERNDTTRVAQVTQIKQILTDSRLPFIIAGDFNAQPGSPVIDTLDSFVTRTCVTNCGFSIPEDNPTKLLDYIGFSPAGSFTVKRYEILEEKYASDHRPVVSVLVMQ